MTPVIVAGIQAEQLTPVITTARDLALALHAELAIAHVATDRYPTATAGDGSVTSAPDDADDPDERVETFPSAVTARLTELLSDTGIVWHTHALAGGASAALSDLAERLNARMFVVGARPPGFGGSFHEFLAGSVATQLAHTQARPVVVVPWRDPRNEPADPATGCSA